MDKKVETKTCAACNVGIKSNALTSYNVDGNNLRLIGVKKLPSSGWHWTLKDAVEKYGVRKTRMYPVCKKCYEKIERLNKKAEKSKK